MVPMRERGHDGSLEVFEDRVHGLATFWSRRWQPIHEIARLHGGQHRVVAYILEIIRHPVHYLVSMVSKLVVVHSFPSQSRKRVGPVLLAALAQDGRQPSPEPLPKFRQLAVAFRAQGRSQGSALELTLF